MTTETLRECPRLGCKGSLTVRYKGDAPNCYRCGYEDYGPLPVTLVRELVPEGAGRHRSGTPTVDRVRVPKYGDTARHRLATKRKVMNI